MRELTGTRERADLDDLAGAFDEALGKPVIVLAVSTGDVVVFETEADRVDEAVAARAAARLVAVLGVALVLADRVHRALRRLIGVDVRRRPRDVLTHEPRTDENAALRGAGVFELAEGGEKAAVSENAGTPGAFVRHPALAVSGSR